MSSKEPAKPAQRWAPSDRLSFDKATRNDQPPGGTPIATKPIEDTHLAHPAQGQHRITPTNHKAFNRQKKG